MAISQHLCYIWKLKLPISGNPGSHLNCTGLWTTLCATHLNGLKSQWIAHNMHYFLKTHHYGTKQSGAGKCSAYVICVWRAAADGTPSVFWTYCGNANVMRLSRITFWCEPALDFIYMAMLTWVEKAENDYLILLVVYVCKLKFVFITFYLLFLICKGLEMTAIQIQRQYICLGYTNI